MAGGLKGHQTPRRIALHSSHVAAHLANLAERLRQAGHPQEADTLGVASVACDVAAYSLAAKEA